MTQPRLTLSTRELNALRRIRDLAWDHVQSQSSVGKQAGSKGQRSVWAAGHALDKIHQFLKEQDK